MKIFYINGTHWDREWYSSFQYYRYCLVDTLNRLIDIMESDLEYKFFCLDGQTVLLEDYEEVEPENAKRLKKLIESGRIIIGPGYVMPDEFLVSGESLIRNLMVGHKVADRWGAKAWNFGYVNDVFGHIAQMPQIWKGFGIEGAYISRGVGNTDFTHFRWKAPDGSICYTTVGYYAHLFLACRDWYEIDEWHIPIKEYIDDAAARTQTPIVLISNTSDHCCPNTKTKHLFDLVKKNYPDAEICDVNPAEITLELKKYSENLLTIEGELAKTIEVEGQKNPSYNCSLLQNCLSSYYNLKFANDKCQNLLEKRIEPMMAFAKIEGNEINHRYVEIAYDYLLKNQAHDSICGCSIDSVHKDMDYRFDQTKEIANKLYDRFLEFENKKFYKESNGCEYHLKLYNFKTYETDEYIAVDIEFYPDFKVGQNSFKIFDAVGGEVPYQILKIQKNVSKRVYTGDKRMGVPRKVDIYTVALKTKVPAMGYTELRILPSEEKAVYPDEMNYGTNWVENEFIRLDILSDGRLKITDKRSGRIYDGLNEFCDNAEVGDGWNHRNPLNDEDISSRGGYTAISRVAAGNAIVIFKIEKKFEVPVSYDEQRGGRSKERKLLSINMTVSVKKDSPIVNVECNIDNTAKDHRLRVLFPTDVKGNEYFAGQAFYRNIRKTGFDRKTLSWQEPEQAEKNMNGIIGKNDESGNGLAFVSAYGLHEGACLDDSNSTIAVTLFRAFDKVVGLNSGVLSQLQQMLEYKYAIVPLSEDMKYIDLLKVQNELSDTDIRITKLVPENSNVSLSKSLIEVDNPNIMISIFKCAEDKNGYILRLFNVSDEQNITNMVVNFKYNDIYYADLNENILNKCFDGGVGKISFKPWEIKTIKIQ